MDKKTINKGINKPTKILHTEYSSFREWVRTHFCEKVLPYSNSFLDPWAGTAPLAPVIELSGKKGYFNDILPIHFFINRAKAYPVFLALSKANKDIEGFLLKKALRCMAPIKNVRPWISDKLINDDMLECFLAAWNKAGNYDQHLKVFLRALIILCVRSFSNFVKSSSHPNWLKTGGRPRNEPLEEVILSVIRKFLQYYAYSYLNEARSKKKGSCSFYCKEATSLSFRRKFDVIFTSPSYRNSTDLYNMYLPELHLLKHVGHDVIPSDFIGTNIVRDYDNEDFQGDLAFIDKISPKTKQFIDRIFSVQSEKSNYYPRVFTRHYARLFRSIQKLLTLLVPNGSAYIIVQTNFHRGGLNEMGKFLLDFFSHNGWKAEIVDSREHNHSGKRNISKRFPICPDKVPEHIVKAYR